MAPPVRVNKTATEAVQRLGYDVLKPEQLQVVSGIISGREFFAVFPTGFGKSLCFTCLPAVFDLVQRPSKSACCALSSRSLLVNSHYMPRCATVDGPSVR